MYKNAFVLSMVFLCAAHAAYGQSFVFVGSGAPDVDTFVDGISADGRVAAGAISPRNPRSTVGVVRTDGVGTVEVFGPTSPSELGFIAMSDDGRVAVAIQEVFAGNRKFAHRYINGVLQPMGQWANMQQTSPEGTNRDGSVVVGWGNVMNTETIRAFRWTPQGGYQTLQSPLAGSTNVQALDVSADGSTVVGYFSDGIGGGPSRPVVWRNGVPQVLQGVGGEEFEGGASNVTSDGRIIVGGGVSRVTGRSQGVVWRDGVAESYFGPADTYRSAGARDVSEDGTIVYGSATSIVRLPGEVSNTNAAVWINNEFFRLEDYLAMNGVAVPSGWTLYNPKEMSDDGRTFVGYAINSSGLIQGYIASVPTPGSLTLLLGVFTVGGRRRSRRGH